MTFRGRLRVLAALVAAACSSDPTGGGDILVVSQIDVQPPGATIPIGGSQQLTGTPKTSSGITVPNRPVTWSSEDQGIATVSATGLVTGVSVGGVTITAHVESITRDVTINVTAKPVASVSVEPPQATIPVGGTQQLLATPRDAQGEPLQGRPVTFQSDNAGVASVSTTGLVTAVSAGNTTIRATSEGRTGTSTITVSPRPATRLAFTTQPANGVAGQALAPIRVAVQDELGGTIPDAITAITLSIADNAGGATLGGTVTANAVAGVATFSTVSLDKSGTGYTLRASALPLTPGISSPFNVAAGAASRLAMATQPAATAQSGTPLAVQPVVGIVDAGGNAVAQGGVNVTVQIVGAGATLAGNLTVATAANGTATFTNLTLTGNSGNYSLRFVAAGLVEVVSNPIALTPGIPTGLQLLTPPSSTAKSGIAFAQQPVVQLRDDDNNPVAQSGVPVTASPASGGGTLSGIVTVATNASGQAAFTNLALSGPAGAHTIAFSSPNLGQVVSPVITLTGGAATSLKMVTQPSATATNGAPLATQPSVQLSDAGGNAVAQAGVVVTASVVNGPATVSGTVTATTNSSGLAVFTNLSLQGPVGTYRLLLSAAGLTGVESNDILLGAGSATQMLIVTQPSGASNSVPLAGQPRLQLADVSGNLVPSAGVVIAAALASGPGVLSGTLTAITNSSGIAQFVDLTITGAAGTYTIRFTAPGITLVVSNPIPLGAGSPSQLTVTTQPSTTAVNGVVFPQQPTIQVRDAANNPVAQAGIPVTAAIATGGGTLAGVVTVNTNASGLAIFGNLSITGTAGDRTLAFTSGVLALATSNTITITAGAASKLALATQPSATVSSGTPFPQQPVVQLQDNSGNAVSQAGTAITATIESGPVGGGTLGGATVVVTSAAGQGTYANLSLSGTSGAYTLRFSAIGLSSVISSTVTLGAGAATKLTITTQPSGSVQNGDPFPQQPAIQLRDAGNNPVSQAGVQVTATIQSGGPTLSGTLSAFTNASGLATFTDLEITGATGDRTLIFASSGLASVTSNTITVTPGDPAALTITTQPAATEQSGVALTTQPAIQVRDGSGNQVTQSGIIITAAIVAGSPAGTLANATATTNGNGLATFSGLTISGLIGSYTLRFTTGALPAVTSNSINLTAGPPAELQITTQPSGTVQNDVAFPTQPVIQVTDAGGNPVSNSGITVTASIGSGAGTLGGTLTATTNGSGVATFTDLKITGTLGTRTLTFSATSLDPATSNNVVVEAGVATQMVMFTQPPATVPNGAVMVPNPTVALLDISGNSVDSAGVLINVAILAPGTGTLGGTTTVATDANGHATFTDLTITGSVGNRTLRFTHAGFAGVNSNFIGLAAGPLHHLAFVVSPPATANDGVLLSPQPTVAAVDVSGNTIAGISVTASVPGGWTLGGTVTAATDGAGIAVFTNLVISGPPGSVDLTFSAAGAPDLIFVVTLSAEEGLEVSRSQGLEDSRSRSLEVSRSRAFPPRP